MGSRFSRQSNARSTTRCRCQRSRAQKNRHDVVVATIPEPNGAQGVVDPRVSRIVYWTKGRASQARVSRSLRAVPEFYELPSLNQQ